MSLSAVGRSKCRRGCRRNRVQRSRRLRLECLEDRRLLAFDWQSLLPAVPASAADVGLVSSAVGVDDPVKVADPDAATTADIAQPYVAGEVIVALREELTGEDYQVPGDGVGSAAGLTLSAVTDVAPVLRSRAADGSPLTLVKLSLQPGLDVLETVWQLELSSRVLWAAPNYVYQGDDPRELVPDDPQYAQQYHHTRMQNDLAWDTTQGAGTIVAVTDDGFDLEHEDLAANIWANAGEIADDGIDNDGNGYIDDVHGWDFSSNDNNPRPENGDSHGTHVAGIIAACTNNAVGVAGAAGQATIMPIRFYGSGSWTSSVIAASYAYAVDNGAQIISTSYSVDGFVGDPTFLAGLQYVHDHGVLHFNSAGNNNQLNPPRQVFEQSLMVASTTATDAKSSFSNYGTGIDLAAPGSDILSTLPGNSYGEMSGTSMATPNAAAVAALIWSAHPAWTADQVAAQLLGTADNIDAVNPGLAGWLGAGRVNSYRAVTETLPPPRVDSVPGVPPDGGRTTDEIAALAVRFDQVLEPATADDWANYELREAGGDGLFDTSDDFVHTLARPAQYLVGTNQVALDIATGPLRFGHYRLSVRSGGIRNPFDVALDGNADGTAGDDYRHFFAIDVPPLAAVPPLGSMTYSTQTGGRIHVASEIDTFTLQIAPQQTITVAVDAGATLQVNLTVSGPSGFHVQRQAAAAGESLQMQNVMTTVGGSYQFAIGSVSGTSGTYTVHFSLNAAAEQEWHRGPTNDGPTAAEDLTSSFVELAETAGKRGVILGELSPRLIAEESFEAGTLGEFWTAHSSQPGGRIRVSGESGTADGSYAMLMDRDPAGSYNLNEATWQVDLSQALEPILTLHHTDWNDEPEVFSGDFQGSFAADGIAISDDGLRWHPAFEPQGYTVGHWTPVEVDLAAAAEVAGFVLDADFFIKFQQYDNYPIATDGRGYDELAVVGKDADWYAFTLGDGEFVSLIAESLDGGAVQLELYDPLATRLASGVAAANADQVISRYRDVTNDGNPTTYYARVWGIPGRYSLTVTTGADFDIEPNSRLDVAQRVDGVSAVLGHTTGPAALPSGGAGSGSTPSGGSAAVVPDGTAPTTFTDGDAGDAAQRVIIRFAADPRVASREAALREAGFSAVLELPLIDAVVAELPDGMTTEAAVAFWSARGDVVYAEPDDTGWSATRLPNDPRFSALYGLHNTGQSGGTLDADIDAPEAWEYTTGAADVVVAVIDTGVDYRHEDLAANMWVNPGETPGDGIDNDGNGYIDDIYGIDAYNHDSDPLDDNSHGTHVSGTIAGVGNNGVGVTGVNWTARIMALKFLGESGSGATSSAVELLQYATKMKTQYGVNVVVSNNSWGGGGYSQALYDAIAASNAAGILFVAAAGNASNDNDLSPSYPASYELDGIVAVAATDRNDALASFSSYGATSVDLAAPGVAILSSTPNDTYSSFNGTSMATPHVAGAAALLKAFSADASPDEVKTALLAGVDPVDALQGRVLTGGRLNVAQALALIGRGDVYAFEVTAGDTLVLQTATPGHSTLAFTNDLDPQLELYDPAGTLLASDDNGAGDGRNARLAQVAAETGTYRARVLAAGGRGEYILSLQGTAVRLPPLEVTATQPDDGELVGLAFPGAYTVTFSAGVLLTSVDAGDLLVGGVPSTGVRVLDGRTLQFAIDPAAYMGDGQYTVSLAAGTVLGLQGQGNSAFAASFLCDTTGPRVSATAWNGSPLPASRVLTAGPLVVDLTFDEPVRDVPAAAVALVERTRNVTYAPLAVRYDAAQQRLTAEFGVLPDGDYRLTLAAGDRLVEDLGGNNLDGEALGAAVDGTPSGNGQPGGDYVVDFSLDADQIQVPGVRPLYPLGSLVAGADAAATIAFSGDQDLFLVGLEADAMLTVVVTPAGTLQPDLAIQAPDGSPLAGAVAAAGQKAAVQMLRLDASGRYRVSVTGAGGSQGAYSVAIVVNAAVEVSDSGPGAGLAIDGSRLDIGSGRWAVLGSSGSAAEVDEYALDLTGFAGGTIDLLLSGPDRAAFPGGTLELLGTDGVTVLATGTASPLGVPAENYAQGILDFAVPSGGVYTVRVSAAAQGDYALLVVGGLVFDSEPNTAAGQPLRSLDGTGSALGFAVRDPVPDLFYYPFDEAGGTSARNQALPGTGLLDAAVSGHTLTGAGQFGTALTGAGDANSKVDTGWVTSFGTGSWTIGLWLDRSAIPYSGNAWYLFGDPTAGRFRAFFDGVAGAGNAILRGPTGDVLLPGGAPSEGAAVIFWVYDGTARELRGYVNGQRVAVVARSGLSIRGTDTFRVGAYQDAMPVGVRLDEFRAYQRALSDAEIAAIGGPATADAGGPIDPASDRYTVTLTAGQSVSFVTQTPFDVLPSLPFPPLDPQLLVLKPDGTPLLLNRDSGPDGRNAVASFLAPESGVYEVEVLPEAGSGAYLLGVEQGPRLVLELEPNLVSEDAGTAAVTGRVQRNTSTAEALTVTLQSSDTTEAVAPASVTIPASQAFVEFTLDAVDDALLDGPQTVILTASAAGYLAAVQTLIVLDYETLSVTIAAEEIAENDGPGATTATVTRSNTDDLSTALTVTLSSSHAAVHVPASVTIPAGQASVVFDVDAVDNGVLDGTKTVTLTAAGDGYVSVTDSLAVTDPVSTLAGRVFEDPNANGVQDTGEAGLADLTVYLDANDNGQCDTGERTATSNDQGDYTFSRVSSGRRVVRQLLPAEWAATFPSRLEPVFDVDFDEQAPGPVVTQPNSDPLPLTKPTNAYIGGLSKLEVVAAAADLTQQPVSMEAIHGDPTTFVSTYVQLRPPESRSRGVLTARWQSAVLGPPTAADWSYIQIAPARDAGGVYNGVSIYYDASGRFRIEAGSVQYVGAYRIGQADAFALTVDLNTDTYDLLVNGTLLSSGALQYAGDSVYRLWFRSFLHANQTALAPPLVVDNIRLDWVANDPGRCVDVAGAPVSDQNFGIARPLALAIADASVPENAGAGARTVIVNRGSLDISVPLEVTLQSSDPTEAVVPASVTIPAGQSSVQFSIDVVDDALLDGPQTVILTASAAGHLAVGQTLTVLDHETLSVTIAAEEIAENDGPGATTATVTRSNTDDLSTALTVTLSSSHGTVQLPASVTIPAGQVSTVFDVDAVDNGVLDGTKIVTLTAAGAGYVSVTDSLAVTDPVSTLSGRVFEDPNANGVQDTGEAGLADLTVYLDANDNGQWDSGEQTATSNDQGDYTFSRVPAGRRVIRQLLPAGWAATVPAPSPTVVFDVDFNQQPLGAVLTQPNTGPWPLGRPTSVTTSGQSTAAVIAAAGNLLDQPVLLSGATTNPYLSYARIKLDIPPGPGMGVLSARWKAAVTEMPSVGAAILAFNGYLNETTYNNAVWVRYDPNGKLYVADGTGTHEAGTFTPGTADVFDLTVDIPADTYTLQINGRPAAAGALYYAMLRAGDLQFSSQLYYGQPGVAPPLVVDDISILWQPEDAGHSIDVNGGIPVTGLNFGIGRPVTLALPAVEVREDSGPGAVNATISRGTLDTTGPLTVTLQSSDTSEAVVPASVTIPAGQSSVQFSIDVIDDALLDGPQTVIVTASAAGYLAAAQTLTVLDHETLSLAIAADQIAEGDGPGATTAILSRSNIDDLGSPLVVTLTSSDGMVLVPATVEIPAGQASVSVAVDTWNNRVRDGRRTATITASAPGYEGGADAVEVSEPEVIVAHTGVGTYVAEGGGADRYTLVLGARPTADVVVQLQADAQVQARDQAQPLNAFLTFTPDNWNAPQVVVVNAVNDSAREGPHYGTIAHTVTSANPQYDGIPVESVVALVRDDDEAPPVANHDLYTTRGGDTLVVAAAPAGLLANDTDADGDALTATLVDAPFHGTVALSPDGSFTYIPASDFRGEDRFTYVAHDGLVDSLLAATVTIRVETPRLVKDISHLPAASNPQNLLEIDGIVYFTATDFEHGTELWRTDGTPAGTWIVKDIVPGPTGSSPTGLAELDGQLYFGTSAYTGLWKSDGTAAGTVVVASASWWPSGLVRVGSVIYFQSSGSTHGYELWKSDGTAAGTTLVKDINPGSANSSPRNMVDANGILFFTATTVANGEELWRSDGTEAGTWLVKDILPGSNSSYPAYLTNVGGTVYLRAYDAVAGYELWKSDGTDTGTSMVKDLYPGGSSSSPAYLAELNGMLCFQAYTSSSGYELWKSDGTDAGTSLWKDINPTGSSYPAYLVNLDGTLYFQATDGVTGTELWKSDGTSAGTVRVADINPGGGSSSPLGFVTINGTILFSADDGSRGRELWRSDDSGLGTVLVADLYPHEAGSSPTELVGLSQSLLFAATEPATGTELWISNGTAAGTSLVKDIQPGTGSSYVTYLTRVGEVAYFYGYDSTNGYELWRTDGTAAGTWLVKNINPSGSSYPAYLTNVDGILFFRANDGASGIELWRSDGTAAGTNLVKDIVVGSGSSSPTNLLNVQGTLFFVANDGIHGDELWKSDGTEAGTTLVKDILPGNGFASIAYLTCVGDRVYFRASDGVHGSELWVSDGTEAGTTLAKDINPGGNSSYPYSLASVGSALYFQANNGAHGYELWRSDGTEAGTTLVKDIYAGANSSSPSSLTNIDGTLYFQAYTNLTGFELWRSDGTEAGTVLVKDIAPGSAGSSPARLTNVGGVVLFAATTSEHGTELWRSDGTSEGTVLAGDLAPGPAGSAPDRLTVVGTRLYFTADDGTTGRELWIWHKPLPEVSVTVAPASVAEDGSGQLTYTFSRNGPTDQTVTVTFSVMGTAAFPSDYAVSGAGSFAAGVGTVTLAAGSATAIVTIGPIADDEVEEHETVWLQLLPGADYAVGSPADAVGTIANDDTGTLIVTQFTATATGFTARFGRDLEPSVLNLYDSASQELGPADVTVTGAAVGPVHGSLAVSADQRWITFVQSGGLLAPDTYTVTLFSGAARFRDTGGGTLDGNADGTSGDDYQTTFTVSALPAGTVTISLPDMARGAGQSVNVPNTAAGLPIRLDNAAGVTALAVDLVYDPALLNITAAALAAGVPGDWTVTLDTATAGVAKIRASGTAALSGTDVEVVRLTAAVPSTASYGAAQAIRLENVAVNGGAIAAVGDVAVHKAVYLGDADGSGIHSSADAFLTVQAALGLASGFAAHAWTDPRIVGDADGSGVLSAADAFLIVQEGLGLVEPFVADNPHIGIAPVGSGVDPQFQIDVNLPAAVGDVVSVPVKLALEPAANNVGAVEFDLFFDPARLTIQLPDGVSAGADTAGWAVNVMLVAAGSLRVGMVSSRGQPLTPGLREIAWLQFHVGGGEPSRTGWQPVRDGLPTRPTLLPPITDHRLPITDVPDGSETHPAWLDIEPVDLRAGGYTWTDSDGSVLIRRTERGPAAARREQVWRDLDAKAELLDGVLTDLTHEMSAPRR